MGIFSGTSCFKVLNGSHGVLNYLFCSSYSVFSDENGCHLFFHCLFHVLWVFYFRPVLQDRAWHFLSTSEKHVQLCLLSLKLSCLALFYFVLLLCFCNYVSELYFIIVLFHFQNLFMNFVHQFICIIKYPLKQVLEFFKSCFILSVKFALESCHNWVQLC